MPVLEKITVSNFRNIEFQELEFAPNVNCISGNNGEGKTNLLDAIYYLSMTKSAFSVPDSYIFRYGTDDFSVCGSFRMHDGLLSKFSVSVNSSGEKKVKRDGKAYPRISAHIGTLPIVMVSPSDASLVSESGEERRKFVNSVLSQMDAAYLDAVQQYNRLLFQRNRYLKERNPDRSLLSVFNSGMARHASVVYGARKKFAEDLCPVISEFYASLSGGSETVDVQYKSDLDKGDLGAVLENCTDKDMALGYTSAGIQRDDFSFTMDGRPIRRCGSQGQQKSFIVSLKFAQYEIMKKAYGFAPVLLLDDVFDKLDMGRISNLLGMVSGNDFGQIFITDSNKVRLKGIVDNLTADRAYFETFGGKFEKI